MIDQIYAAAYLSRLLYNIMKGNWVSGLMAKDFKYSRPILMAISGKIHNLNTIMEQNICELIENCNGIIIN